MESEIFFALLIPIAIIVGIIYLIIYLVRRHDHNQPPIDWRRFGVGTAISFILPFFIGFTSSAVFEKLQSTEGFVMMTVMSAVFIILGLIISHHTVISASLIIGSIIALIYAFGLNIETIPAGVMAVLAGLGLAILIYFAYVKLSEKEEK